MGRSVCILLEKLGEKIKGKGREERGEVERGKERQRERGMRDKEKRIYDMVRCMYTDFNV